MDDVVPERAAVTSHWNSFLAGLAPFRRASDNAFRSLAALHGEKKKVRRITKSVAPTIGVSGLEKVCARNKGDTKYCELLCARRNKIRKHFFF